MTANASFKLIIGGTVCLLFIIFHSGVNYFLGGAVDEHQLLKESHIFKIKNTDASLSVPYLGSINKFWHVGGSTEIRNTEYIRLTKNGKTNDHGIIISNGLGDNTMDNVEIIVKFRISPPNGKGSLQGKQPIIGDGLGIVITPENDFITQDLRSSYARRQYQINSGGVSPDDTKMMGFPSNLPGMSLIIDTYQNVPHSKKIIPFLDAILITSPGSQYYDIATDGVHTSAIKLNNKHLRLKESIIKGDLTKLRVIYLESINFLKVDIQYGKEGSYWIELFQKQNCLFIPKNSKTGQRYIGIGALTGDYTESVDILEVETNEFHWKNGNEDDENSLDFAEEIQKYFVSEYNERISIETNDFQRWKMLKSQPNYLSTNSIKSKSQKRKRSFSTSITIASGIIMVIIYLASVYIRVTMKHIRREKCKGILPS